MTKIKDLVGKLNIVVRLSSTKLDPVKFEQFIYNYGNPWLAKDTVMITGVEDCRSYISVRGCYTDGSTFHWNLPPEFEVSELGKLQSKVVKSKIDKNKLQNLYSHLYHDSMCGSDPEIFVVNGKDELIPAFEFLGSKKKPSTGGPGEYGNKPIYWDGFQAEFETHAITCLGWHTDSVQSGLKGLFDHARKYDKTAKLSLKSVMDVSPSVLKKAKDEHVEFGCTPSLNVYGLKGLVMSGRECTYRTAGGHIHFGIPGLKPDDAIRRVKALDAILAVSCVSLFEGYDVARRRSMYGLAGEYRLPKHGLEYRTLSNAWLSHPLIMNMVFDLARKAMMFGSRDMLHYWKCKEEETIRIIQENDVNGARKILSKNQKLFTNIIDAQYNNINQSKYVVDTFMNGMDSAIEDPNNIINNWNLDSKWVAHSNGVGKNVSSAFAKVADKSIKKVS